MLGKHEWGFIVRRLRGLKALAIAGSMIGPVTASAGQASLNLKNSTAVLHQENGVSWALDKTGSIDANDVVTYTISALEGAVSSNFLRTDGYFTLYNSGSGSATIGNIVVNLQRKSGSNWHTVSSVIANATSGNSATSANICPAASSEDKSSFSDNSASGTLQFMDAKNNTVFSLTPKKTIPGGGTESLLFQASFNNTVLAIPTGESVRLEIIVSFGNVSSKSTCGSGCTNVDIDGDGIITPDEAVVRSVPTRITLAVPPVQTHGGSVVLADQSTHITTDGTATFSSYSTNIGGGSGQETLTASANRSVSVLASPGASGGDVKNCANLDDTDLTVTLSGFQFIDVPGLHLQSCATVAVAGGYGFQQGDEWSFGPADWGNDISYIRPPPVWASAILINDYNTLFPAGIVDIGMGSFSIPTGYTVQFDSSAAIQNYLTDLAGTPNYLSANLIDPLTTSSGVFGGDVLALAINVALGDARILTQNLTTNFGDLIVVNTGNPGIDGQSIRSVLAIVNRSLGAAPETSIPLSTLDQIVQQLNLSFYFATPSTWATQHLHP